MPKTRAELKKELDEIGNRLNALIKDFAVICRKAKSVQMRATDKKKIVDLKNKIKSL